MLYDMCWVYVWLLCLYVWLLCTCGICRMTCGNTQHRMTCGNTQQPDIDTATRHTCCTTCAVYMPCAIHTANAIYTANMMHIIRHIPSQYDTSYAHLLQWRYIRSICVHTACMYADTAYIRSICVHTRSSSVSRKRLPPKTKNKKNTVILQPTRR